jgi:8-oxo-dGTP pyrophosphatase MutT (NUDIX family)
MTRRRGRAKNSGAARKRGGTKARGTKYESSAGGVVFRMTAGQPLFLLIRDSYGNWGFPKGHLERGERADGAALREVTEETGLQSVNVIGAIETIEWWFRFRGALIHKNCQFFLMESANGETNPQRSEGITACRWTNSEEALQLIGYENARGVLRRAHEMVVARAAAVPARTA